MENSPVRPLTPDEYRRWDEFVERSPQGTLFHSTLWLSAPGHAFRIYGYFKGTELRAGFAIESDDSNAAGHAGSGLTPYLGVVFAPQHGKYVARISSEKEIARAIAKALKEDYKSIWCRFPPEVVDLQPFIWEGFDSKVKYTYRLDLADMDRVWDEMEPTRRNDIRRAEKDGVTVERGRPFAELYSFVEKTFTRQGRKPEFQAAATRHHEKLAEAKRVESFTAKDKDARPLGAVYIVWDSKRAYYILGGYDMDNAHHGANALAMWEAIKFTKQLGLAQFDFEGSMLPAVEAFFRKFGATLTPTYYVSWEAPVKRSIAHRAAGKLARMTGLR